MSGELFGYADDPWLPTYLDIEYRKAQGDPNYADIGFDQLDVPEDATHVIARFATLNTRFIGRYGTRLISHETLETWQVRLQDVFDSVVGKYERAYTLYENNLTEMNSALPGSITTTEGENVASGTDKSASTSTDVNTQSGTDTVNGKTKHSDTPDSAVNTSDNYSGSIDISEGSTGYGRKDSRSITGDNTVTYGKTDKTKGTTTQTVTGAENIESVNRSVAAWRDIDTDFVGEFENLFLNILWY